MVATDSRIKGKYVKDGAGRKWHIAAFIKDLGKGFVYVRLACGKQSIGTYWPDIEWADDIAPEKVCVGCLRMAESKAAARKAGAEE